MESTFKLGSTQSSQQQTSYNNGNNQIGGQSQPQAQKISTKNPLFSMDTLNDTASSFRIRNVGSKDKQQRVPTIYGMPKLQTKTLPKLDSQLAQMMINEQQVQQNTETQVQPQLEQKMKQFKPLQGPIKTVKLRQNSNTALGGNISTPNQIQQQLSNSKSQASDNTSLINDQNLSKLPSQIKPSSRKLSRQLQFDDQSDKQENSDNKQDSNKSQDLKEESKMEGGTQYFDRSRLSTAKSTISNMTEKSLAHDSSVSRNASNNFGPALNKHLPIVLQLVKKKQDLAAIERIHELKQLLIQNGGEEAESIVTKMGLK